MTNGIILPRESGMRRLFAAVILGIVPVAYPPFRLGCIVICVEDTHTPKNEVGSSSSKTTNSSASATITITMTGIPNE